MALDLVPDLMVRVQAEQKLYETVPAYPSSLALNWFDMIPLDARSPDPLNKPTR